MEEEKYEVIVKDSRGQIVADYKSFGKVTYSLTKQRRFDGRFKVGLKLYAEEFMGDEYRYAEQYTTDVHTMQRESTAI